MDRPTITISPGGSARRRRFVVEWPDGRRYDTEAAPRKTVKLENWILTAAGIEIDELLALVKRADKAPNKTYTHNPPLRMLLGASPLAVELCVACEGKGTNTKGAPCPICQPAPTAEPAKKERLDGSQDDTGDAGAAAEEAQPAEAPAGSAHLPAAAGNPGPAAADPAPAPAPLALQLAAAPVEIAGGVPTQAAGRVVVEDDSGAPAEPVDEGPGFASTGDPVHDARLAGCKIPEGPPNNGGTSWNAALGQHLDDDDGIDEEPPAPEPKPEKPKCQHCGSTRARLEPADGGHRCLAGKACEKRAGGKPRPDLAEKSEERPTNGAKPTPEPPAEEEPPFELRLRLRKQKAVDADTIEKPTAAEAFAAALATEAVDGLMIEWRGTERLAVLDLDWHGEQKPSEREIENAMRRVLPSPAWSWRSHGGGAHLVYHEVDGFEARELAACGAVCALDLFTADLRPDVEVVARTRHPRGSRGTQVCGPIHEGEQSLDRMLVGWRQAELIEPADDEALAWLAERGLKIGGSFPHTQCPFDPRPTSSPAPVQVFDDGIHCYVCRSKGHASGGRASWARLVGSYRNSRVVDAARGWVFFGQAKHLLRHEYPHLPVPLLRPAWSALLKLIHGPEDPRLPRALAPQFILMAERGVWLDSRTLRRVMPRVNPRVLSQLPSTMFVDEDGKTRVSPKLLDLHETDQEVPGFPEVTPIRGVKLWGHNNPYLRGGIQSVIPTAQLGEIAPTYVPAAQRPPIAEVQAYYERHCPGIDFAALQLYIVARAYAESGVGPIPMILSDGPTGAAKTTTVRVAAAALSDRVELIDEEEKKRFAEAIGVRAPSAGFILLDEFAKGCTAKRALGRFNLLLNMDRQYNHRANYQGPTTARVDSVICITNNAYPREVMQHQQLGRRMVYAPMRRRAPARWEDTCGCGDVRLWRTVPEHAAMADALLSHIIDELLPPRGPAGFHEAAQRLGFELLEQYREATAIQGGVTTEDVVRELFALVCHPDTPDAPPTRWRGRGWKLARTDGADPLTKLWYTLCDDPASTSGFMQSERVAELDLGLVLGVDDEVRLELSPHGRSLGMRFVAGRSTRGRGAAACQINEEITTLAPPAPEPPGELALGTMPIGIEL